MGSATPGRLGKVRRLVSRARKAVSLAVADPQARAELPAKVRREVRKNVAMPRMGRRRVPVLSPVPLPEGPIVRPGLRVATVLDAFSDVALRYEWDQIRVTPQGYARELAALEGGQPDLLFVESAWHGNDDAWHLHLTDRNGISDELRGLVAWCKERGVPTVFWNKEDPPNYDRFIEAAGLFDHVFTVDADCIPQYQRDLGHDRVGLLPFAAQPRIHNPVRRMAGRPYDVAFAGSWFSEKHPSRREHLDYLLRAATEWDLHIYDRMNSRDPRYRWPAPFNSHVVGSLPYERMLGASTAYKAFISVSSVTESPTMCARRLFELSASQTAIVSGPSAAIEPALGDVIQIAHDQAEAERQLRAVVNHREYRDRLGLRAHRRVMDSHTYSHRVDEVLGAVGLPTHRPDRSISAVIPTMRPDQADHVLAYLGAQIHKDLELVLVTHGFDVDVTDLRRRAADQGVHRVEVVPASKDLTLGACMNLGVQAASGRYVAKMDDDNVYSPHYLSDLVRAFDYSEAAVVGKWAHYAHLTATGATLLRFPTWEHRYVDLVQGGTILVPRDVATRLPFEDLPRRVDTTFLDKVRKEGGKVYAADRFNFVSVRASTPDGHTWPITDTELLARQSELVFYGDPVEHVSV